MFSYSSIVICKESKPLGVFCFVINLRFIKSVMKEAIKLLVSLFILFEFLWHIQKLKEYYSDYWKNRAERNVVLNK